MKKYVIHAIGLIFIVLSFTACEKNLDRNSEEFNFENYEDAPLKSRSQKTCEDLRVISPYEVFTMYYGNNLNERFKIVLTDLAEIQEAIDELSLPVSKRSKICKGTINLGRNYNCAPWNFHLTECSILDFAIEICDASIYSVQDYGCKTLDNHCDCEWTPWLSKLRSGPHTANQSKILDFDIVPCQGGDYSVQWSIGAERNLDAYILQTRPQAGVEWRDVDKYVPSNNYPKKVIKYSRKAPVIHPCFQARIIGVNSKGSTQVSSEVRQVLCS